MARVAYLSGRSYAGVPIAEGEVPALEQTSRKLIEAAGAERGIVFEVVYWDLPDVVERGYDAAIIRTCWDYHDRPEAFIAALESFERAGLPVYNSSATVRWNSRKTYLKELGPSAIETIWADRADVDTIARAFETLGATEIVVKPQVGAGSVQTLRLHRDTWRDTDLTDGPTGAAMIQPFLRAIAKEGEWSLFWFGGAYSHAVRKTPASGSWLANIPGRTAFFSDAPPPAVMTAAEAARALAPRDLLYARIDLVLGNDEAWRVIEIEAIEPYLFLDLAPEAARAFVGAIAGVLSL